MSKPTFRAWAIATAAAVQKGQDPLQEALKFASDRKVSLSSEQIARLRQIVDAEILPLLNKQRVQTGPKREMTDDLDGVSAFKRQKMDDNQEEEEKDVADSLGALQLDDLPDEIIDLIAVQLGNVFDMGSLRATSTRFGPLVDNRRDKLKKALQRPYSGEAFVDYSNQDNIARLLKQTRSRLGPRSNMTWLLQWLRPMMDGSVFSPEQSSLIDITIDGISDPVNVVVQKYYKTRYSDHWKSELLYRMPRLCSYATTKHELTANVLLQNYVYMQKSGENYVDLNRFPLYAFLSVLSAATSSASRGISTDGRLILDKCTRLVSLWMIFYELKMAVHQHSAFFSPAVGINTLDAYFSYYPKSKIGGESVNYPLSWTERVITEVAPDFATRITNDEYLTIRPRIESENEVLRYLIYTISKLNQDIKEDTIKITGQMFIWFSHCAAQTQEQVDRCDTDPLIVSILAWDHDDWEDTPDKALMLAARAYIICTGTRLNFDAPTNALEEMLGDLKNEARDHVNIETWNDSDDEAADQESLRQEFEDSERYIAGTRRLAFLSALNQ